MRLSLFAGLRPLSLKPSVRDILAGVSLASINIPQVLGYSRIAGAPIISGLYTLLLPLVAFAVFGSSRHLVVAADSATAAIFSGSLSRLAVPASAHYMALVGMVALLTAGLLLLARIFKLGFLADFLSRTVLTGFLTGVGFQVGIAMLGDMFGVAAGSHNSLVRLWQVLVSLPHFNVPTLALSMTVAAGVLVGVRYAPRLPLSLIAVVATIAASRAFHFADHGIAVTGRGILLRHDHRAKRGDGARIRAASSRERGRERRHPWAVGRERGRGAQRGLRGQREPHADRHG